MAKIEKACEGLGVENERLVVAMITNRRVEEVMGGGKRFTKRRLGSERNEADKIVVRERAKEKAREINAVI